MVLYTSYITSMHSQYVLGYANFCKRCYAEVHDKGHYLKKEPTVNFVDLIRNISRI